MLGILALAVLIGSTAAVTALISGHSLLMALAIYSGSGVLGAFFIVIAMLLSAAIQKPSAIPDRQPDATA